MLVTRPAAQSGLPRVIAVPAPHPTIGAPRSGWSADHFPLEFVSAPYDFHALRRKRQMGRRILLAILTMFAVAPAIQAQATGRIVGRVTGSADGRGLPSIQVTVTGTTRGAVTDTGGRYTIVGIPAGGRTVLARGIGFQSLEQ